MRENLKALQSATIMPANMHNLEGIGKVDKDYFADLLILDQNPLEDINNTRKIHMLVSNGEVFDAKKLQALKDACKNLN